MSFVIKFILLATVIPFSSIGMQLKYFELLGFTGLDSLFPKYSNWLQSSNSIFAKPLGACSACNYFWIVSLHYGALIAAFTKDVEITGISLFFILLFFYTTLLKTTRPTP